MLAIALVVLPLAVTIVVKYLPLFTGQQGISTLAMMRPRVIGPKEFMYLEDDAAVRLHNALAGVRTIDMAPAGGDLLKEAAGMGAGALLVPTLTVDAGIVQLNLQVIETQSGRILFNTPYQSSMQNYPDMMKAAGAALQRLIPGS